MEISSGPGGRRLENIPIRVCQLLEAITVKQRQNFSLIDTNDSNFNDAVDGCLGALHILWNV